MSPKQLFSTLLLVRRGQKGMHLMLKWLSNKAAIGI